MHNLKSLDDNAERSVRNKFMNSTTKCITEKNGKKPNQHMIPRCPAGERILANKLTDVLD